MLKLSECVPQPPERPEAEMTLDCQTCGACCGHDWEITVENGENVPTGYLRSVRNVIGFASFEADYIKRMNKPDGVCAALKGKIGADCSCKIYDRRPNMCREFAPGTPECLAARSSAGVALAA